MVPSPDQDDEQKRNMESDSEPSSMIVPVALDPTKCTQASPNTVHHVDTAGHTARRSISMEPPPRLAAFNDISNPHEFEAEVRAMHAKGLPTKMKLLNVHGDGNCLVYSLLFMLQVKQLLSTWYEMTENGRLRVISRNLAATSVRRMIKLAAKKSKIDPVFLFSQEGEGEESIFLNLKLDDKRVHDVDIADIFKSGFDYTDPENDPGPLGIPDIPFVRYFAL
jgi:hypothetical protein